MFRAPLQEPESWSEGRKSRREGSPLEGPLGVMTEKSGGEGSNVVPVNTVGDLGAKISEGNRAPVPLQETGFE